MYIYIYIYIYIYMYIYIYIYIGAGTTSSTLLIKDTYRNSMSMFYCVLFPPERVEVRLPGYPCAVASSVARLSNKRPVQLRDQTRYTPTKHELISYNS